MASNQASHVEAVNLECLGSLLKKETGKRPHYAF